MEMLVDLSTEPLLNECSEYASKLLADGNERYAEVREEAESLVVEWQQSVEDCYPLLDPLGPELGGGVRGELSDQPLTTGYTYGIASDGVVRVKRLKTDEFGASTNYCQDRDGRTIIWLFDERDDLDFHKVQGVSVSRVREDGVRLLVYKNNFGDERRTAFSVSGRSARVHSVFMRRNRREPEEQFVGNLDSRGRPLRIIDPRTGYVFYERKRRGDPDRMIARIGKALAKQIPKLVETWAAGREIDGVCLMHGDGPERFPPAVLPILSVAVERERLQMDHTWEVWDPTPWLDVVDPIHFDVGVSTVVDEIYPDLYPWMLEQTSQRVALRCIDELVEKLGKARWPSAVERRDPFVVYRANYEEGDWRATFREALTPAAVEALAARGDLPPPHGETDAM